MNRKERRAAEAASRQEPPRRLPVAPSSRGAVHAFHARRVAVVEALASAADPAPVLEVARDSLAFGNALVEREAGVEPPACAKGCSFCCYVDVAASVPEVALVTAELRRSRDDEALQAVRAKLAEADLALRQAPAAALALRVPCAFLGEGGACTIYEVRPLACRGWNSLSVSACEQGFANGDATTRIPLDPGRMTAASAVAFATATGVADLGLDGRPVRLIAAVRLALEDPDWLQRWRHREPVPAPLVHAPSARAWAQNAYPPLDYSRALASRA